MSCHVRVAFMAFANSCQREARRAKIENEDVRCGGGRAMGDVRCGGERVMGDVGCGGERVMEDVRCGGERVMGVSKGSAWGLFGGSIV